MSIEIPKADLRAVVCDCDGVLLESVACKGNAFRRLFAHEAEHVDDIVAYHFANGGLSRYAKFDFIYAEMLHRPLTAELRDELAQRFSELVTEEVMTCPMVAGASDLLAELRPRMPLFVASATPQQELVDILERRSLATWFTAIWGHPTGKADAVRQAAAMCNCDADQVLFIGDARADYEAAASTGCRFIGRQPPDGSRPFAGTDVTVVSDCRPILDWIRS